MIPECGNNKTRKKLSLQNCSAHNSIIWKQTELSECDFIKSCFNCYKNQSDVRMETISYLSHNLKS